MRVARLVDHFLGGKLLGRSLVGVVVSAGSRRGGGESDGAAMGGGNSSLLSCTWLVLCLGCQICGVWWRLCRTSLVTWLPSFCSSPWRGKMQLPTANRIRSG